MTRPYKELQDKLFWQNRAKKINRLTFKFLDIIRGSEQDEWETRLLATKVVDGELV